LRRISFYIIAAVSFLLSGNLLAGDRIAIPEGIYYHRFASYGLGAEASWINPAALAAGRDIHVQYIGEYEDGRLTGGRGITLTGEGIGITYRSFDNRAGQKHREFIFAGGIDLFRDFYTGFSYRYFKDAPGIYNKRHFWNIGFLIDKYPTIKLAAVYSNLNRGKVNDIRSEIEQLYSISYITTGGTLVLSAEITMAGNQSLSDGKYRVGGEFRLSEMMNLYGAVDEDRFFQLGIRIGSGRYYGGLQSRFDSDSEHIGSSYYVGTGYSTYR